MRNIFGKNGSLLLAGALAFTFASCDTDTRSEQSVKDEAESRYEDGRTADEGVNDPSIRYDQGEYNTNTDTDNVAAERQEDVSQYNYQDREQLIQRVRNDLDRAQQSMAQLNEQFAEGKAEQKQNWEESRRDLEERQTQLNQRLEEAERSTEENWEQVRNDISESLDELEQEWEKLKEKDIKLEDENQAQTPNTEMDTQQESQEHLNNQGAANQNEQQ